jgi:hypothetical protein
MDTSDLRKRTNLKPVKPGLEADGKAAESEPHPAGEIKHGGPVEILRLLLMVTYFLSSTCSYVLPLATKRYR